VAWRTEKLGSEVSRILTNKIPSMLLVVITWLQHTWYTRFHCGTFVHRSQHHHHKENRVERVKLSVRMHVSPDPGFQMHTSCNAFPCSWIMLLEMQHMHAGMTLIMYTNRFLCLVTMFPFMCLWASIRIFLGHGLSDQCRDIDAEKVEWSPLHYHRKLVDHLKFEEKVCKQLGEYNRVPLDSARIWVCFYWKPVDRNYKNIRGAFFRHLNIIIFRQGM
jgi:hypothetical protein